MAASSASRSATPRRTRRPRRRRPPRRRPPSERNPAALPTLLVISGPAGTGKTALAHRLARELGCPAICRDEVKEGLVFARADFSAAIDDELTRAASTLFFDVVGLLVARGTTIVAEAAFQHHVWAPRLGALLPAADVRIVQCHADPEVARERIRARGESRGAHADHAVLERGADYFEQFTRVVLDVPTIAVDTTEGYEPPVRELVRFATARR